MSLNFLKSIESKVEAEVEELAGVLQSKFLPGWAALRLAITPETTPDELTTLLDTEAKNAIGKELGPIASLLLGLPEIKAPIDKAVAFVVKEALPAVQTVEKDADTVTGIFAGGGVPVPGYTPTTETTATLN